MHYYIVDPSRITQHQFERVQNELYSSLSNYKVAGEIVRNTGIRTIKQLVESGHSKGAKTIVAVGTEETFDDLICASFGKDVTLGFVPIKNCELAEILGIQSIEHAAKSIAARRIEDLDIGLVNGNYFFTKLNFQSPAETEIKFKTPKFGGSMKGVAGMIINSRADKCGNTGIGRPTDGQAEMIMVPMLNRWQNFLHQRKLANQCWEQIPGSSLIHGSKIEIQSPEGVALRAGSRIIAKTPATVEIISRAIKVIVGRDRKF